MLAQFNNLLIVVLLAAVVVTALIGHRPDAAVTGAVVLLCARAVLVLSSLEKWVLRQGK